MSWTTPPPSPSPPSEALSFEAEALQAVAGSLWTTVVVAVFRVGGQPITAWRDGSTIRGSDQEKASERSELMERDTLEKAKVIPRLEATAELAMLWEGDTRVAGGREVG